MRRHRLLNEIVLKGRGVHSNEPATLILAPAHAGYGIVFERTDLKEGNQIPASLERVVDTQSCTVLANRDGVKVATVEHLMAALYAMGVTDCHVKVSGPEVPILDGCSQTYMEAISQVGLKSLEGNIGRLKILKPIEIIHEKGMHISLKPCEKDELSFHFIQDFKGREGLKTFEISYKHGKDAFDKQIARARSFGFYSDAQKLWDMGLAKGSSLENALVFQDGKPMNEDGMRYDNEPVCHKVLDALGDFYLGGMDLIARVEGYNAGHGLNNSLMRKVFEDPSTYEVLND